MTMTEEFTVAKITALKEDVEEEVTLEVDGLTLVCFAVNRPMLNVGDSRKVQLKLFTVSDYGLVPASDAIEPSIERVAAGFGYHIVGTLVDQGVSVGDVTLRDETLPSDYAYLMGEKVSLTADRIGVRFLRELSQ